MYPPPPQTHPKFQSVAGVAPLLYSRALQMGEEKKAARVALGDAVAAGTIANETLAYFIGRTYLFCLKVGGAGGGLPPALCVWGWGRASCPLWSLVPQGE